MKKVKKSEKDNNFLEMPSNLKFEDPIRDEIFSPERLEQYALYLSSEISVAITKKRGRSLLPRLEENYQCLVRAYKKLAESVQQGLTISPAGEWFIDNFHIIEEQVREVREDLPEAYYRELPKTLNGDLAGYPQVYVIALALVAHQDSHIDIETVRKFLHQYQTVKPLLIGEVWAIAIALRLVLIENLRRLANQIVHFQEIQEWADDCADQILSAAKTSETKIQEVKNELIKELEKSETSDLFIIVQLSKRLREQSSKVLPISDCLEQHLASQDLSFEHVLHAEYQRQAASQVTVSNIVGSMRLLSNIDWQDFFENVNLVDPILAEDPSKSYDIMDFKSRDRYRHVIEKIQKKTGVSEIEIASDVLALSEEAYHEKSEDPRKYHVGYYLIDHGLKTLEQRIGYHTSLAEDFKRKILDHPSAFYFSVLFIMTLLILTPLLFYSYWQNGQLWSLALIAIAAIIPISDSCLNLLNLFVTRLIKPRVLPKIDLDKDIPNLENAFVIVPTILADKNAASRVLDGLEIRYLSNHEDNLFFALLSDFVDSNSESMDEDSELLDFLISGIDELNQKYSNHHKKFFLFHRKRLWNCSENKWMGFERKRGKIHEFNRFLRGAEDTSFIIAPSFSELFSKINYVITLDSDTQLPRGSAKKLLGTILHPLNRPQFNLQTGRVIQGYGILQPRISITPESSERSWFARIFSGHTGIDPYTTAVSDVYQDLFGEGIYTGKGLYHVDCFEKALAGRVPENALLSHDLFEGLFARTALVTEIEFLDDYPSQYEAFGKRQHRWSRGDWQILPWLFPYVPGVNGTKVRNHLPLISRWKIFDNLRRSLVSTMMLLWLFLGWTVLPGPNGIWSLIALLVLAFPFYAHATSNLLLHPRGNPWTSHFWNVWGDIRTNSTQLILSIICIPHQAYLHSDAILRTLYRVYFSKKNLLNWQTAADVESRLNTQGGLSAQLILAPIFISLAIYAFLFHFYPRSLIFASPFLLSWILFPIIIKKISRIRLKPRAILQPFEIDQLRNITRKTWNFFETFVTEEENWLAPDNFQEDPKPLVAHRTSPTNMGLLLLSTCSAHNLGYIGSIDMLERLRRTLSTMLKLERCFGHFYNWYNTQTLQPLDPKYISTVDSGNLAGHLITVKQSCLSIINGPIISHQYLKGIFDTLKIVEEKINKREINLLVSNKIKDNLLQTKIQECLEFCTLDNESSLFEYRCTLMKIKTNLETLDQIIDSLKYKDGEAQDETIIAWIRYLLEMSKSYISQIDSFLPNLEEKVLSDISHLLEKEDSHLFSKWQQFIGSLGSVKSMREHQHLCKDILNLIIHTQIEGQSENILLQVQPAFTRVYDFCNQVSEIAIELSEACDKLVGNMDFKSLFNSQRKLFSIGYNVEHGVLDNSFYDLLASESRLASFIAIAKGDVPQSHWFHLGRQMTSVYKQRALISWSASMFEYLMPLLVMKNYSNTLLNETQTAVIKQQITYSKMLMIPWGISESAYNARDLQMNYQYGPFGIPGLGLKRGLSNDIVISPYSTALAAMVSTLEVFNNFKRLIGEKLLTDFGFYESIDYTKSRIRPGQNHVIIRSFMIHHQGMILTSLDNVLNDNVLQNRFHDDLMVRSSELLLQERTPKKVSISHPRSEETHRKKSEVYGKHPYLHHINLVNTAHPITQVLSNGKYTVALTASGSGFSKCGNVSLSRWNEDSIRDGAGNYIFIEDTVSNLNWSASFAPMNKGSRAYKTSFSEHKAEFWCHKNEVASHIEVIVSSEDDVEMRRITLINHSDVERILNITSYLEPILTTLQADIAHPAFSNLFIETEYIPSRTALLAHRRKRSLAEDEIWGIHLVTFGADNTQAVQYETSRNNFIGRTNDISTPRVIKKGVPLSSRVGAVLDPILSLRKQVTLAPNATVHLCFVSGLTHSREEALRLIDRYHHQHIFDREDEMGWTQSQAELRHLDISFDEAKSFQKLGNSLLYPCGPMRSVRSKEVTSLKSQSALWTYGISGDNSILFVIIKKQHEIPLIRQLLHAHEYFRYKGISYDLVILNAETSSYRLELQDELLHQVRMAGQQGLLNKDGGIFVLRKETIPAEDISLFRTIARIFINAENGNLREQIERLKLSRHILKDISARDDLPKVKLKHETIPLNIPKRQFENGFGGFTEDEKEYVIFLESNDSTPAPWCNVIANDKEFGFLVSERGSSCTWSKNSRENRITPWSNDPVSDPSGESIYLVDLGSGEKWSPTPAPMKGPGPYKVSHGQGYTHFENNNYGIQQRLLMFCSTNKEVKVNQLTLKNESNFTRKLSLFYYVELVLGSQRSQSAHHIITEQGKVQNVFFARNPYSDDFGKRLTYTAVNGPVSSFTCNRESFLGLQGNCKNPSGLNGQKLNGQIGAGLDPCFTLQVIVELAPHEEKEINFLLGQTASEAEIYPIVEDIFRKDKVVFEFNQVRDYWDKILNVVQIKTSLPEFDILINRWLLYQNLSCRIWARTAFYQSGGAFGFRDQLQDVTALLHCAPQIARKQILLAAACQFKEGDVLHWWHPPSNKGVRTHFSDDLLWLPFTVATYVKVVGDYAVIDEVIPFIEGPELAQEQEDLYFQPQVSEVSASLYDHCVKAIDRSLELGVHGLPLIGTGDWNDGMNQIGVKGKGESVWMAWFLITTLRNFMKLCEQKNDTERIVAYKAHIRELSNALETAGWDGKWYKRAFFDDGTPLGSIENDECTIDSLTQSWAALSEVAKPEHLEMAMASLSEYLVKEEDQLIILFTPPFDKTKLNPGYIKGYPPGVRENGGQYTHAAVWAAMAFAANKDGDQAFKIMSILNPINHSRTKDQALIYKVEPYVISADVYSNPSLIGRGGWSWYTGSAGWYYRAFTESILGIYREGNNLRIDPCLPKILSEYQINYKFGSTLYKIQVKRSVSREDITNPNIFLIDDGEIHYINIVVK